MMRRGQVPSDMRTICLRLALLLLLGHATARTRFTEVARLKTRGNAGFEHFNLDGRDYLAVANFFTSAPGRRADMSTTSVLYECTAGKGSDSLELFEVQRFPTIGAHGWEYFRADGEDFLVVPNYYGGDTVLYRWDRSLPSAKFAEVQRIQSDGAGSVESFVLPHSSGSHHVVAVAEFNRGVAALYLLREGKLVPWVELQVPGVGSMATITAGGRFFLLCACYVTQKHGWRVPSRVFVLDKAKGEDKSTPTVGARFVHHQALKTVGAHDVETFTAQGRGFAFFSNDRDENSPKQHSALYSFNAENAQFELVQQVATDGAHAAEFFRSASGRDFIAVANLGDRQKNTYRRKSEIFAFHAGRDAPLESAALLSTRGATDFEAFSLANGARFLAVANEQDDVEGADIESVIWSVVEEADGMHHKEL